MTFGGRGRRVLIVGAGFAGAVHARELAEAGYRVDIIDARDHVGGNAHDHVDGNGVRIHTYGPHLFHTNDAEVVRWVGRFGDWMPYRHRVRARLGDGRLVPFPINLATLSHFAGRPLRDGAEAEAFLATRRLAIATPRNAAEFLYSRLGRELTDLFFRPYSEKMWALRLEELPVSVVRRVPLRLDGTDAYFPDDRFQLLPRDGYDAIFAALLRHDNIVCTLGQPYDKAMSGDYDFTFTSMPIDAYFDFALGELPYRSIRFHHRETTAHGGPPPDAAVVNFTGEGTFTRETYWELLPNSPHNGPFRGAATAEEPCDYRDNNHERYYPVKTADGRFEERYQAYRHLARALERLQFIGRCGTYQYLDMHQVINQSLLSARRFVEGRG